MRLWHEALIPLLPDRQLLGQHRECCALRGLGWGRNHSTVNYAFQHPIDWLVAYHIKVMQEMSKRGYRVDKIWYNWNYRGKRVGFCCPHDVCEAIDRYFSGCIIYPEHNDEYLQECLDNLRSKGIEISL